jgi:hypothetical protein
MKKVIITIVFLFGVLQLIRPTKNIGNGDLSRSIEMKRPMPADVKVSLQKACYDCHSNTTKYPWYAEIQPLGWYLTNHVREGKQHLNFDEFLNYDANEMDEKMEEVIESQTEGWMPMDSYTLIHKEAILTAAEKNEIIAYAKAIRSSIGNVNSKVEEKVEREEH